MSLSLRALVNFIVHSQRRCAPALRNTAANRYSPRRVLVRDSRAALHFQISKSRTAEEGGGLEVDGTARGNSPRYTPIEIVTTVTRGDEASTHLVVPLAHPLEKGKRVILARTTPSHIRDTCV